MMVHLIAVILTAMTLQHPSPPAVKRLAEPEEMRCLAENIYHEARGESDAGQMAVALTTLSRVRSHIWPDTICGVVYQDRQFSWTMRDVSVREPEAWLKSQIVARQALVSKKPWAATFFHAISVNPEWSDGYTLVATIGNHKFYRF